MPPEPIVTAATTLHERARREDLGSLALLAAMVTLAGLVKPGGPHQPLWLAGRPLPALCPIHRVTGHRCPSCGLTRGIVYCLRLDLRSAVRANPLAPIALVAILGRAGLAISRLRARRWQRLGD